MSEDVKRDVPAVPSASQIAAAAAKPAAEPAAKSPVPPPASPEKPAVGLAAEPAKVAPPPVPPLSPVMGKPGLGAASDLTKVPPPPPVPPLPPVLGKPVLGAAAEPTKVPPPPPVPPLPPVLGKPVLGAAAEPMKAPPAPPPPPPPGKPVLGAAVDPPKPMLPPAVVEKPAAERSGRGLAWLALIIGLLGLAAGVVAVAGPRLLLLADRQFPQATWIEPAGKLLNPGWSVTAAEFDRRVNLLEGVLAKAQPGAVSREDIVELLLGRFEGKRGTETRDAVEALKRETADLGRGVQAARQASEAQATTLGTKFEGLEPRFSALGTKIDGLEPRFSALGTKIDGLEPRLSALATRIDGVEPRIETVDGAIKGRLDAIDGVLAAAKASVDEVRGQLAPLGPLAERAGRTETEAAALAKRLDETAAGLEELKRRAAGPERLLVSVLQLQISSQSGRPFANELRLVRQIVGTDAALARPLDALSVPAQRGAPTAADLRDQFGQAGTVLVERGMRESRSWIERVEAGVKGTLAGVGLTLPPPLTPVEASVREAQRQLANGNLLAALAELETLDASVRALAGGWVAQAQLRLAVDQAVADITNAALERAAKAP